LLFIYRHFHTVDERTSLTELSPYTKYLLNFTRTCFSKSTICNAATGHITV